MGSAVQVERSQAATRPTTEALARGGRGPVPRLVLLYGLVLLIGAWSLFPILYMLNLSLMETVDLLGRPPKALAIPPSVRPWSLLRFGQTDDYQECGAFGQGKMVSEL